MFATILEYERVDGDIWSTNGPKCLVRNAMISRTAYVADDGETLDQQAWELSLKSSDFYAAAFCEREQVADRVK